MLQINALGPVSVEGLDERHLALVTGEKRLALFIYLLLAGHGGFIRRDLLLPLLWPDADESRARHALRSLVLKVRAATGDGVVVNRGDQELAIDVTQVRCDVLDFDQACAREDWARAVNLYRGPLLEGFGVTNAQGFEEWLEGERARLEARAVDACRALARETRSPGAQDTAVGALRRALTLAPYDERVVQELMETLVKAGDRAGALVAYEGFAEKLKTDLEVEPSEETVAIAERLRAPDSGIRSLPARTGRVDQSAIAEASSSTPRDRIRLTWWASVGAAVLVLLSVAVGLSALRSSLSRSSPQAALERLAVLPFENLSSDDEEDFFVDGMHEAVITELAQIGALSVISRLSVLPYRNTNKTVRQIATELRVDAVLEASMIRVGDSVRIHVQLIGAVPERHIWARTYDEALRNILALQSRVARAIAAEVRAGLTPEEEERFVSPQPVSPDAYEAYLRGKYQLRKFTLEGFRLATDYFSQTIAIDSAYAPAYVGLAEAYRWRGAWWGDLAPAEAFPVARTAVEKALALDSGLAEAHSVLGSLRFQFYWDWKGAEEAFRRAIALNPSSTDAHGGYANFLRAMGRTNEGVLHAQRSVDLSPLDAGSWAELYMHNADLERWEEAEIALQQTVELDSLSPITQFVRGVDEGRQDNYEAAARHFEAGGPPLYGFAALAHVIAGNERRARELLDTLSQMARGAPYFTMASVYAAVGDSVTALDMLERAHLTREANMVWFRLVDRSRPGEPFYKVVAAFQRLRPHERYQTILERMAFPE